MRSLLMCGLVAVWPALAAARPPESKDVAEMRAALVAMWEAIEKGDVDRYATYVRQADGDYEIYSVKPDGSDVKLLTRARGNGAHMAWSPDGPQIAFASSRMGFKDEMTYTDSPQPYGEIFVMRADGTDEQQLTDNQWEEGTPAWRTVPK